MKFVRPWTVVLSSVLATMGSSVLFSVSAHAVTTPAAAITNDPNAANGTLTFYDSSGNVITGGTDLSKIFTYAAASTAGRQGATKATVYFAFPDHTKANSVQWFQKQVTPSTTYPATGPATVSSLSNPVSTAGDGQADLGVMLPTTVQDHTAGYDGIVQVRLRDSGPGVAAQTSPFWASDIFFDAQAGTWQQVFPAGAQSTTTAISASPVGHAAPGQAVTLTATVSPSTAAGAVDFLVDGGTAATAVPVVNGTAGFTTSSLPAGPHTFKANFAPTDSTAYTASTSSTISYVVAAPPNAPTSVRATAGHAAATVTYAAPTVTNGRPVTGYDVEYSSNAGRTWVHGPATFHTSTARSHVISGLRNGLTYVFRVAAYNVIGLGAYSATSNAVKPFADSSALTIGRSITVHRGKAAHVTGILSDTRTHTRIGGATVVLYHRAGATKPWVKGVSARTGSTGGVSILVRPTATTFYQLRYFGTTVHTAVSSASMRVAVVR